MRRINSIRLVMGIAWLTAAEAGHSQCAMCKQALLNSAEGQRMIEGINTGILFLLGVPFLVVGTIAALIFNAYRQQRIRDQIQPHNSANVFAVFLGRFRIHAWIELLKPRILAMVLVSTAIGFYLGGKGIHSWTLILTTLLGIGGTAGGAAVLNHYLEREEDALMERTRNRPLPRGVIAPADALTYGVTLILIGVILLVWRVNLLAGFLSLLAAFLYVLVYTPLKRVTWLNTTIGAIPGAIPPLCGWAAATGQIDAGAWALFLVLFIWQHPHFYAIAWLCRDDYRKGGFQMLSVVDPSGRRTFQQILGFTALLTAVSMLPVALGGTGWIYLCGAGLMGLILLAGGALLATSHSTHHARQLFLGSLVYLPALWTLLILDSRIV